MLVNLNDTTMSVNSSIIFENSRGVNDSLQIAKDFNLFTNAYLEESKIDPRRNTENAEQ